MNWMNLPKEYSSDSSQFAILPIEYEGNLTYGSGTSKGPCEIIKASRHLEYYEDQFNVEPFEKGIELLKTVSSEDQTELFNEISSRFQENDGKFILSVGGDHSITLGPVHELNKSEDFSVIVFDAHSDFRDSWNGSSKNHACVSKRISETNDLLLVGIRSQDVEEKNEISNNEKVHEIKAYDFSLEKVREILPRLKKNVYVSIDVDVFDPSFIRNTGTPEPGGLTWNQVVDSLILIFKEKNVIGSDIVEFSPENNSRAEAYSLARLIYKIFALKSLQ